MCVCVCCVWQQVPCAHKSELERYSRIEREREGGNVEVKWKQSNIQEPADRVRHCYNGHDNGSDADDNDDEAYVWMTVTLDLY